MNEFKKHTDKVAISILRCEYADYDQNWWHYDREYKMLLKAQTEAFKLANDAAEQQGKEAIDTVVSHYEKSEKVDFLKSAKQPSEITYPYDLSKK